MLSKCEDITSRISDYLEGALDNGEKLNLEQHCKTCVECYSVLNRMGELSHHLQNLEKVKTSDSFQAVLRSRLRKELEHESETIIDKIVLFFQSKTTPALGYSLAVVLFFAYISYDIYHHSNENRQPFSSSVSPTTLQELRTIIPDQKPIVLDQEKSTEKLIYILEKVKEKDILKDSEWSHAKSIKRFEQQLPLKTDGNRNRILLTNLQTVTF